MQSWLHDRQVALVKTATEYCADAPFHADTSFPEFSNQCIGKTGNPAFHGIRQLFQALGWDAEQADSSHWNPLRCLIEPGQTVVIKPNLVAHRNHGERHYGITDTDCLITHGSVIRAVLDYVAKALGDDGKIIIGDCPIQGTSWEQAITRVGLDRIQAYFAEAYPQLQLVVQDYRLGRAKMSASGIVQERVVDDSRRAEYQELDLGEQSLLLPLMQGKYAFGVSQYPKHRMVAAHTPTVNKYLLPQDFIYADVMINLPKMKSHMKAGITCALKNFVGVNGHKDYLPHFRFLSPKQGGDEYPDGGWCWDMMWYCAHQEWEHDRGWRKKFWSWGSRCFSQLLQWQGYTRPALAQGGGGWHGNDTLWRTILDIHRAYLYYDRTTKGMTTQPSTQVKYLAILDGIIGGEKESPLSPSPIKSGYLLAAQNPLALDTVACALMRLDYRKLKQLSAAYEIAQLPLASFGPADIQILGSVANSIEQIYSQKIGIPFEPSHGFKGAVEYH